MCKSIIIIEFLLGSTIENAVEVLLGYKEKGLTVYGTFNEVTLCSDTVTLDGAYKCVTGKTKAEFDETQRDYEVICKQEREWRRSAGDSTIARRADGRYVGRMITKLDPKTGSITKTKYVYGKTAHEVKEKLFQIKLAALTKYEEEKHESLESVIDLGQE